MDDFKEGEVEDLATLARLDEKVLLNELKVRYNKNRIYVSNTSKHKIFSSIRSLELYPCSTCEHRYSKFCSVVMSLVLDSTKCKHLVARRITLVVAFAFSPKILEMF